MVRVGLWVGGLLVHSGPGGHRLAVSGGGGGTRRPALPGLGPVHTHTPSSPSLRKTQ